jgi:putative flippase GtrA
MVSGVAIVISQVVILICAGVIGLSGIASNTLGAVAATPASYELNRKWAWGKKGKSHMWREVVPFWVLTVIGYAGSTGTVQLADTMTKSHGVHGAARLAAIMGASLFAYGVVWIVKFIVFNHIIFAVRPTGPGDLGDLAVVDGTGLDGPGLDGPCDESEPALEAQPARSGATELDGQLFEGSVSRI